MNRTFSAWASPLLGLSLALLFVAERVVGTGTARLVLLGLGGIGILAGVGLRAMTWSRARGAARAAEAWLLWACIGVLVALGLYALSTDWAVEAFGWTGDRAERLGGVLTALWPSVMLVSLCALLFSELVYRRMPVAEAVELRRVRSAALGGISLAFATVFLFAFNYVTVKRDIKKDLSYFKTTKPSESTLNMVRKLGEPVQAVLFFPKVNEVLPQLRPYFDELDRASDKFSVKVVDHALAPQLARQHRVRDNGFVALLKGEGEGQQAETFEVGNDFDEARLRLRKLDGRFQEAFSKLVRIRRELYLTTGHDERTDEGMEGEGPREKAAELKTALERSNVVVKPLGVAQGLSSRVPHQAPAVAVIGPRKPFLPEEAESLLEYVRAGGRLVVMVDPDVDHGLEPLLSGLGLELLPGIVASNQHFVRRTRTPRDQALVYSNRYSAHPTVTIASRNSSQIASIFVQGGALRSLPGDQVSKDTRAVFPIRTVGQVWRDRNGNWDRDPDEPLETANMMAAVTVSQPGEKDGPGKEGNRKEGRAVVIADGEFVTDQILGNPGNAYVFSDVANWLLGEEQIVGETTSEEDVPIEHTRDEDKAWFYLTSFGVPLPILGLGAMIAMRRRRRGRKETHGSQGADPTPASSSEGGEKEANG